MTTVAANSFNGWGPRSLATQLPTGDSLPLAASQQFGTGQILMFNASGDMVVTDGTEQGYICAGRGNPAKLSATSTIAAAAAGMVYQGLGSGDPASTTAGDPFTKADTCTPCYAKDGNTIGKLAHTSGVPRPLVGLVFGVDQDGNPISWVGPQAQAMARAVLAATSFPLASHTIADAAANTATAERSVSFRPALPGVVTSVKYTGSALVVGDTDYVTVTVSKRDGAGGGAVVLATYDSRAAGNGAATAFVPKAFTLSVVAGALNLLATDVVTITIVKGGAGQVLTGNFLVTGAEI